MSFDTALKFVLLEEGGYSDDKDDKGGATMHGITQATYDTWRLKHSMLTQPVSDIADSEVAAIYHGDYWFPAHCADLPDRLASVQFDTAVQRGDANAIKMLQSAVGVIPDGRWGPNTVKAAQACEINVALARYFDAWDQHITQRVTDDPSQHKFENGWRSRLSRLKSFVSLT